MANPKRTESSTAKDTRLVGDKSDSGFAEFNSQPDLPLDTPKSSDAASNHPETDVANDPNYVPQDDQSSNPESTSPTNTHTPVLNEKGETVGQHVSGEPKTTGPVKPPAPDLKVEIIGGNTVVSNPDFSKVDWKEKDYVTFAVQGLETVGRIHAVKYENDNPEKPAFATVRYIDENLEFNEVVVPVAKLRMFKGFNEAFHEYGKKRSDLNKPKIHGKHGPTEEEKRISEEKRESDHLVSESEKNKAVEEVQKKKSEGK